MKRMLDHYFERFYNKLYERGTKLRAKQYRLASQMATWKTAMRQNWHHVQVLEAEVFDTDNKPLPVGEPFTATIRLQLDGIKAEHVGLEVAFFRRLSESELELQFKEELALVKAKDGIATYHCKVDPQMAGVYEYGFRMFPKHELLPHRQDLPLVEWI